MRVSSQMTVGGHPTQVAEIEDDADYSRLLSNILESGYYDSAYFRQHSGYQPGKLVPNFWFIAEIAAWLGPRRVLEVGCGRGDVLRLLRRRGVEVRGVDFSADVVASAWPEVRTSVDCGDLASCCRAMAKRGERFDLLLGFDIWEHLTPRSFDEAVEAALSTTTPDAFCYFVIPAFGRDEVFGEQFPLELEATRADFEARRPFRHLTLERDQPPIPTSGHLIWAHAEWWRRAFERHGLVRMGDAERGLHRYFDAVLPPSNRSFYFFRRSTPEAAARERSLGEHPYSAVAFAQCAARFLRAVYLQDTVGRGLIRYLAGLYTPPQVKAVYRGLRSLVRRQGREQAR